MEIMRAPFGKVYFTANIVCSLLIFAAQAFILGFLIFLFLKRTSEYKNFFISGVIFLYISTLYL